ncbi:MAG: hypothetical protein JKY53_00575 [Flavobacteriales bacterium]|nr:hypothetical protein [Flavobacteriales bacterium]
MLRFIISTTLILFYSLSSFSQSDLQIISRNDSVLPVIENDDLVLYKLYDLDSVKRGYINLKESKTGDSTIWITGQLIQIKNIESIRSISVAPGAGNMIGLFGGFTMVCSIGLHFAGGVNLYYNSDIKTKLRSIPFFIGGVVLGAFGYFAIKNSHSKNTHDVPYFKSSDGHTLKLESNK